MECVVLRCRLEVFHPPYEFRPNRPRFTTSPPNFVPYGSTFEVGYAFDEPADIAGVVLVDAGGVSAGASAGHRELSLREVVWPAALGP